VFYTGGLHMHIYTNLLMWN